MAMVTMGINARKNTERAIQHRGGFMCPGGRAVKQISGGDLVGENNHHSKAHPGDGPAYEVGYLVLQV
jgi:hypothetical protein